MQAVLGQCVVSLPQLGMPASHIDIVPTTTANIRTVAIASTLLSERFGPDAPINQILFFKPLKNNFFDYFSVRLQ